MLAPPVAQVIWTFPSTIVMIGVSTFETVTLASVDLSLPSLLLAAIALMVNVVTEGSGQFAT